ncbi:unnamed protein product [Urochloa decumbens]|uniref:Protein kinase domain-containing protein n=1 Tax=Urochloa decumbens TaxID=240449 RepID=A0ABC9B9M8_9POAL
MAGVLTSAATIPPLGAATAMAMMATVVVLQLAAAAQPPPLSAPAAVALPGCNATCGDVEVPYPFGFGPAHCYWPKFNLTCDTSSPGRPRLLLGDGTLRVTEISLKNFTVRVIGKAGFIVNDTIDSLTSDTWSNYTFGRSFGDYGYMLSERNVLFVQGCNAVTSLQGRHIKGAELSEPFDDIIGCVSFCQWNASSQLWLIGCVGCCMSPLSGDIAPPIVLQIRSIYSAMQAGARMFRDDRLLQVYVLEEGRLDTVMNADDEGPLILSWGLTWDPLPSTVPDLCTDDLRRTLCKSEYSCCIALHSSQVYNCMCKDGFYGNPYLAGGCQDIDECKLPSEDSGCRSSKCINTLGSFYCECLPGSYSVGGGCVRKNNSTIAHASSQLSAPAPIALSGCNSTCGNVQVPHPFGFGPDERCYRPGFNLTCDTSYDHPRLLLGDGTFQVVDIFLADSTVRVIHTLDFNSDSFDLPNISKPYSLSTRNEFVLNGCGVQATLHGEYSNGSHNKITLRCNCSLGAAAIGAPVGNNDYCSGTNGCCHAPIFAGSTPRNVTFESFGNLEGNTLTTEEILALWSSVATWAFLAEGSSMDHHLMNLNTNNMSSFTQMTSPLLLQWAVMQGFPAPAKHLGSTCPEDVASRLCMSDHSDCRQEHGGYTCRCSRGYDGNPYIKDGCKDVDECKVPRIRNKCFGDCINLPGAYKCRCPRGTHGNPSFPKGCRHSSVTGLSIGIGVGSGAGFVILVLFAIYMIRKLKDRRSVKLKQKFFKQNHGQLLQQLIAPRADIAERMIIPLNELEKATNNFDKAREVGGGGHGTVYKGILSDLHVVAIKKSNIVVKSEIDYFLNEVALLLQISHRNVVKLFGCCMETEVPLLIYEFVSNGTLYSHLHVTGAVSLSWNDRLRIATETAKAIAYLHSGIGTPIIHRDIKSTNILLDDKLTSKVSDFGASRHIPIDRTGVTTNVQGTIGYLDPSYYYTTRLTEKSDVFSFGVLLVELLTRKLPYSRYLSSDGEGLVAHFVTLLNSGSLVDILDPQVAQEGENQAAEVGALAATCVKMNRDDRPTMRQVELTLEAIRAKEKTSDIATVETFMANNIRRRLPSDPIGRSVHGMTRLNSLEEEFLLSASFPR